MKIIFDVDGTLFAADEIAVPAFRKVLEHYGRKPSDAELKDMLGRHNTEIWQLLLPDADEETRRQAFEMMDGTEIAMIRADAGHLYEGVEETLRALWQQGHELYTLSNCDVDYLHAIMDHYGIGSYFKELICAGHYPGETKSRILARILNGERDALMIGDRFHDITAGKDNGIPTIWLTYGFGLRHEIEGETYSVKTFPKILPIIESLKGEAAYV